MLLVDEKVMASLIELVPERRSLRGVAPGQRLGSVTVKRVLPWADSTPTRPP